METRKTREKCSQSGFYKPFQELQEKIARAGRYLTSKPCPPCVRGDVAEADLFASAMHEVVPLEIHGAHSIPWQARRCPPVGRADEDWEALCCLMELVEGRGQFDLSMTDEYLEGQVPSLDPRVFAALKAGALPIQDYCDLHGLDVSQARERLREFLAQSLVWKYRTVLVVHGRGRNSPQNLPVLKMHVQAWLEMKRFRRQVLAFATAQPYDGGAGALYLLLRRTCQAGRPKG